MKRNRDSDQRGFTLIEILIVVAIIGLLASTVLVGLAPAQRRGRDARRLTDLKQTQNALELYYNKCGHYPGDKDCNPPTGGAIPWGDMSNVLIQAGIGVNQIPKDPSAGHDYMYATDNGGTTYVIAATLEDLNSQVFNQNGTLPTGVSGIDCTKPVYCVAF